MFSCTIAPPQVLCLSAHHPWVFFPYTAASQFRGLHRYSPLTTVYSPRRSWPHPVRWPHLSFSPIWPLKKVASPFVPAELVGWGVGFPLFGLAESAAATFPGKIRGDKQHPQIDVHVFPPFLHPTTRGLLHSCALRRALTPAPRPVPAWELLDRHEANLRRVQARPRAPTPSPGLPLLSDSLPFPISHSNSCQDRWLRFLATPWEAHMSVKLPPFLDPPRFMHLARSFMWPLLWPPFTTVRHPP